MDFEADAYAGQRANPYVVTADYTVHTYLDAGAGYFATKKACEPLHIQYSYDDASIAVVNSTYAKAAGLHAGQVALFDGEVGHKLIRMVDVSLMNLGAVQPRDCSTFPIAVIVSFGRRAISNFCQRPERAPPGRALPDVLLDGAVNE